MFEDTKNLWTEDMDENIVKTWLAGMTSGGTWSINEQFLGRINDDRLIGKFDRIEQEWDEIIGPCLYCKLDDPRMEKRAKEIVSGLTDFIDRINANPDKYFSDGADKDEKMKIGDRVYHYMHGSGTVSRISPFGEFCIGVVWDNGKSSWVYTKDIRRI